MDDDAVALTIRFSRPVYEALRKAAFDQRTTMTAIVGGAVALVLDVSSDDPAPS